MRENPGKSAFGQGMVHSGTDHRQAARGRGSSRPGYEHRGGYPEARSLGTDLLPLEERVCRDEGGSGTAVEETGDREWPAEEASGRLVSTGV